MDAPREMRIPTHARSTIRPIGEIVENTGFLLRLCVGIENGSDILFNVN